MKKIYQSPELVKINVSYMDVLTASDPTDPYKADPFNINIGNP